MSFSIRVEGIGQEIACALVIDDNYPFVRSVYKASIQCSIPNAYDKSSISFPQVREANLVWN